MATAVKCAVIDLETAEARSYSMEQLAPEGFFEIFIPRKSIFRYQLRYETSWGDIHQIYHAYAFLPTLSAQDLYLFNEGYEHRI